MVLLYMGAGGNARDEVFGTFLQKMETDFVNPVSCGRAFINAIILETENKNQFPLRKSLRARGGIRQNAAEG